MNKFSNATLTRYTIYDKALKKYKSLYPNEEKILSDKISEITNIKATSVRRDLSLLGCFGIQGYGYNINELLSELGKILGSDFDEKIILVGCGNIGKAMLKYNTWNDVVGEIVCVFDRSPEKKQKDLDIPIYNIDELEAKMPKNCRIALLCVSSNVDEIVLRLAKCGITGIVDFTREHFKVPENVTVKYIDIISSIQELVFKANNIK